MTIALPKTCIHVICSPNNRKAKTAVKIGLKFKKMPEAEAPNFWTPIFQNTMHRTVETTPVYKRDSIKEALICDIVKSDKLNGRRNISPNRPEYNVDIMGDVFVVAHLEHTEYIPHMPTAASIHKSPSLKCSESKRSMFPLERTRITPENDRIIDTACKIFIFSFKNKKEKAAIEMAFNVEINPTLVAVVLSNAQN